MKTVTTSIALVLLLSGAPATATQPAGREPLPAAEAAAGSWAPIGQTRHPDGREQQAMLYAPELSSLIIIGGLTERGLDDDVWLLDLENREHGWREVVPTGTWTGPRFGASAVWDPLGRRVVIFGGDTGKRNFPGPDYRDDVWALQFDQTGTSAAWVQLHAGDDTFRDVPRTTAPTGRAFHSAAYDPVGHRMLVYGGLDLTTRMDQISFWFVDQIQAAFTGRRVLRYTLGDLWAFDLASNTWSLLSDVGIRRMYSHMAYDPANRQLVATGGYGLPPSGTNSGSWHRGETQSFDLASNRWTTWDPAGVAPAFSNAAYDYSPSMGALLMMGLDQPSEGGLNPRHVYALRLGPGGESSEWAQLPNATFPRRSLFGMRAAVIPGPERFVVMGGLLGGSLSNTKRDWKVSAYETSSGRWEPLTTGLEPIQATEGARAVGDAETRSVYVVGGQNGGRPWRLDMVSGLWEPLGDEGAWPTRGVPVVDTVHRRLIVVEPCTTRIWTFPLAGAGRRWTEIEAEGQRPPICGGVLTFDPVRQRLVLLGGHDHQAGSGPSMQNRQVFALEMPADGPPRWQELEPAEGVPFPGGTGAYDPIGDRVIVSSETGETLALDFTSSRQGRWLELPTGGQPPGPWVPKTFDVANNRLIAYRPCPDGKVMALELSGDPTWQEVETAGDPTPRCWPALAYDEHGRQLVLFGGTLDGTPTNETHVLPLGGDGTIPARPADPAGPPPPSPTIAGGTWEPLGPVEAHPHDVDLLAEGQALLATGGPSHRFGRAAGVYRSSDAGGSWSPTGGDSAGRLMLEIAQSPADPDRVYASSLSRALYEEVNGTGMYVSADGGATWRESDDGLPWDDYWGLAAHPSDPAVAWASGPRGGVYRTHDGGASWSEVTGGTLDGLWANALAAVHTPNGVRLLAGIRQQDSGGLIGQGGVAYSDDGGSTWKLGFETDDQFVKALAVDPSDPSRVLAAEGYGVWRSDDFGTTWEHVNGGTWREPTGNDVHLGAVEFDPASGGDVLWGGGLSVPCDFRDRFGGGQAAPPHTPGVWRSMDGGSTWNRVPGTPDDEFCGLAVSGDGRTILASGVWTGLWRSTDAGTTWQQANEGVTQMEVLSAAADPSDPGTIVAAARAGGLYTSHDGGSNWAHSLPFSDDGREASYVVSAGADRFVALTNNGVYLSKNGGDAWLKTDVPGRSFFQQPSGLAVDPADPKTWYAAAWGLDGPGLAITHDDGKTSEVVPVRDGGAAALCPWNVVLDPFTPGRLYVGDGCGDGLFRSDDGGNSWTRVTADVGGRYIRALLLDPARPDRLWIGTEHRGVFRSDDGGSSWVPAGEGLGLRNVRSLAIAGGRLFASAFDDGVYESDDDGRFWGRVAAGSPSRSPMGLSALPGGDVLVGSLTAGVLRLHTS